MSALRTALAAALLVSCSSGKAERAGPAGGGEARGAAAPASAPAAGAPAAGAPAGDNGGSRATSGAAPAATAAAPPAPAQPLSEEEGAALYATACTSCHTQGFVEGSRISEKGWNAEVAKMRKWGALVDEEQAAPFAAWLSRKYPAAEREPASATIAPAVALETVAVHADRGARGDAAHGKDVYAQACASCHGAAARGSGGGPALQESPLLRQADQVAALARKGKGRMPGYDDLKPADLSGLIAYLRALSAAH